MCLPFVPSLSSWCDSNRVGRFFVRALSSFSLLSGCSSGMEEMLVTSLLKRELLVLRLPDRD